MDFISFKSSKCNHFHKKIKGYTQEKQPGSEKDMDPRPIAEMEEYKAGGKLKGKSH